MFETIVSKIHYQPQYLQLTLIYCYHSIMVVFGWKCCSEYFEKSLLIFNYFLLFVSWMLTFVAFNNDMYAIFWCVLNDTQVSQLMVCNIVSYKQQYMNSFLIYFIVDVFQNHRTTLKRISQAAHLFPLCLKYITKFHNCH